MRKGIRCISMLIIFCLILSVVLAGCEEDDANPDEVRGTWILKKVETVRVSKEYVAGSGEANAKSYAEDYTHFIKYSYTPDAEDPGDGPTPYSAIFYCTVELPQIVEPVTFYDAFINANIDSDGKPGHTGGICCFFGIRDSDLYETYTQGKDVFLRSAGNYNYSYSNNLYPVYAGAPSSYGHLDDPYQESMRDVIEFSFPFVKKADLEKAGSDPITIKLSFCSNAAETVYVYEYVPVDKIFR